MYCVKVEPGKERIRVRHFTAGFLPSYMPAKDPDVPFALTNADSAPVPDARKKVRKLIVPGYVFSLQYTPGAKPVDEGEWRIIEALSDSHVSTYDFENGTFVEGPLVGMDPYVVHAGNDFVQIRTMLLGEERDYWVTAARPAAPAPLSADPEESGDREQSDAAEGDQMPTEAANTKAVDPINYTREQIEAILLDAEKIGVHAAARAHGVKWQTVRSWAQKSGKEIHPKQSRKTAGTGGKAKKETRKKTETKPSRGRKKAADSPAAHSLEAENAALRERVASLEKKIEKIRKVLAELL